MNQTLLNPLILLGLRMSFIVGMVVTLCGCTHPSGPRFRNGSGDAGEFILRQAVLRGAEPITTDGLPPLPGAWSYAADNAGVIIRMPQNEYSAVEALLLQAFGTPKLGPLDTADGRRVGAYRLTPKGAALQFTRDAQWTQVIVLRARTQEETAAEFLRGLQ